MKAALVAVPLLLLSFGCVPQPAAPEPPQPPAASPPAASTQPAAAAVSVPGSGPSWDVTKIRCSQILGADDDDRAAAMMFYYGYLAAKAGIRVIDVSRIDQNIHRVMDQCKATPDVTVPQAYYQALGRKGRD